MYSTAIKKSCICKMSVYNVNCETFLSTYVTFECHKDTFFFYKKTFEIGSNELTRNQTIFSSLSLFVLVFLFLATLFSMTKQLYNDKRERIKSNDIDNPERTPIDS